MLRLNFRLASLQQQILNDICLVPDLCIQWVPGPCPQKADTVRGKMKCCDDPSTGDHSRAPETHLSLSCGRERGRVREASQKQCHLHWNLRDVVGKHRSHGVGPVTQAARLTRFVTTEMGSKCLLNVDKEEIDAFCLNRESLTVPGAVTLELDWRTGMCSAEKAAHEGVETRALAGNYEWPSHGWRRSSRGWGRR